MMINRALKKTRCPVCSHYSAESAVKLKKHRYIKCGACKTVFIDSVPYQSATKAYSACYYQKKTNTSFSGYVNYESDRIGIEKNFNSYLDLIKPYQLNGRLLDIGCAYGFFLNCARKRGFTPFGIDVSEDAINWMKSNLDVQGVSGTIENLPSESVYDLITAFEVLEHIADPVFFIQQVRRRLTENGVLCIATGDAASAVARFFGKKWWYYNPPDHCIIYNKKSLSHLLHNNGFEILTHQNIKFHLVGFRNIVFKVSRVLGAVKLIYPLIMAIPNFQIKVLHNSTQFVIAKKRK